MTISKLAFKEYFNIVSITSQNKVEYFPGRLRIFTELEPSIFCILDKITSKYTEFLKNPHPVSWYFIRVVIYPVLSWLLDCWMF